MKAKCSRYIISFEYGKTWCRFSGCVNLTDTRHDIALEYSIQHYMYTPFQEDSIYPVNRGQYCPFVYTSQVKASL